MTPTSRPLALVTGASSGIGYHLALCCAQNGYDLVVAADQPEIHQTAQALRAFHVDVTPVEVDLATPDGVARAYAAANGRSIRVLIANAGHGLGKGFLDQDFREIQHVVDTNVTGTLALVHMVGREMRAHRHGRILITGSIAGSQPGTFQAVYNGSKAFIDSFAIALRHELKDSGVSVTCLMPGVTDTEFFERADLMDTKIGQSEHKDDPADVARVGFEAMMKGDSHVIVGLKNKLQVAMASVMPVDMVAEQHRKMAEPGTGRDEHRH